MFFANPTNILAISELILEFNIIFHKNNKIYFYLNELRNLLTLSNISDPMENKKFYKKEDAISKDIKLREETEEELCLQLNRKDKNSDIQPLDAIFKRLY